MESLSWGDTRDWLRRPSGAPRAHQNHPREPDVPIPAPNSSPQDDSALAAASSHSMNALIHQWPITCARLNKSKASDSATHRLIDTHHPLPPLPHVSREGRPSEAQRHMRGYGQRDGDRLSHFISWSVGICTVITSLWDSKSVRQHSQRGLMECDATRPQRIAVTHRQTWVVVALCYWTTNDDDDDDECN